MTLDMETESGVADGRIEGGPFGLHFHLRRPTHSGPLEDALILFSHGFSVDGTESHRMFLSAASAYQALGGTCLLFDYRGCGYSDGAFVDFTVTGACDDLIRVASWAQNVAKFRYMFLHGQSIGTAIGVLAVERLGPIDGLVLWNLSADIYERYGRIFGEGIKTSDRYCLEEKGLYTGRSFMDDARRYDVIGRFRSDWRWPVLLLNSGDDSMGDPAYAAEVADTLGSGCTTHIIEGAKHSFKCQPDLEQRAVQVSVDWVSNTIAACQREG